ncbi:hypothetical protein [Marinobacter lipolyticus]|uniref:hypothetical protein n=1 Tax=Marinobacter lipolyticus TaxID=209639 RepID=UPI003A8DA9C9
MTTPDDELREAAAAKLVLGVLTEQDVQGQFMASTDFWVHQLGLVDDNDLAALIDGTLDASKRQSLIHQLCENPELRAIWLRALTED